MVVTTAAGSLLVWVRRGIRVPLIISTLLVAVVVTFWIGLVVEEALAGFHTPQVVGLLRRGFLWFLFRELTFFLRFFWFLLDRALSPSIELGAVWVPVGITPINPFGLPLLNTVILLRRAVALTHAHHKLMRGGDPRPGVKVTIVYGLYFLALQLREYYESPFTLRDSSYGRIFYLATGFHGLHVFLGTVALMVTYFRLERRHFTSWHHEGFQAAALY